VSFALLVLIAVVGCSGQAAPTIPAVGSAATATSRSTNAGGAGKGSTDPAIAWPQFAACLRAHGVSVADPALDAAAQPIWPDPGVIKVAAAARQECQPLVANLPAANVRTAPPDAATIVRFSNCMRDHGVPNFPDPDAAGNITLPVGMSFQDPALVAADLICEAAIGGPSASPSL
jgi:hypothetical protein